MELNWLRPGRGSRMGVRERMSDVDQEQKRPSLTLRTGTLGLNRPSEPGQVKQSFSHGRSKTVAVEVRKKRVIMPGAAPEAEKADAEARYRAVIAEEETRREQEARAAEEAKRQAEEDARRRADEEDAKK